MYLALRVSRKRKDVPSGGWSSVTELSAPNSYFPCYSYVKVESDEPVSGPRGGQGAAPDRGQGTSGKWLEHGGEDAESKAPGAVRLHRNRPTAPPVAGPRGRRP